MAGQTVEGGRKNDKCLSQRRYVLYTQGPGHLNSVYRKFAIQQPTCSTAKSTLKGWVRM